MLTSTCGIIAMRETPTHRKRSAAAGSYTACRMHVAHLFMPAHVYLGER